MPRFDVYANPDKTERKRIPYFLDVQNDHLGALQTRVVVPLWDAGHLTNPVTVLNPAFELQGASVVMDTAALGAIPLSVLRRPVDNLAPHQLAIQNALDTLFGGY